jgi:hypothetical protein
LSVIESVPASPEKSIAPADWAQLLTTSASVPSPPKYWDWGVVASL